jgi:hypothetical protein
MLPAGVPVMIRTQRVPFRTDAAGPSSFVKGPFKTNLVPDCGYQRCRHCVLALRQGDDGENYRYDAQVFPVGITCVIA